MKSNTKTLTLFWIFILAISLLRLVAASQFGLSVDEAHYVLYGKILDWSYFDHPPLVGWVQALFQFIPLNHLIQARLAPILISVWSSKLIFDYLTEKNFKEQHSLTAVIILNLTPIFNALSVALLPDTLLIPITILILKSTEKVLTQSTYKNWLLLGFFLGLAGLSKYTAIFYVLALSIIFIFQAKLKELLRPQLWAGVLVSLALISPVLYWNIKNNFASFQYQANHVLSLDAGILKNLGSSFLIQLISWGLGPFLVGLWGYFVFIKKIRTTAYLTELVFMSVFLIFFIYVAIAEVLLPHWMMTYFIISVPLFYAHFLSVGRHLPLIYGSAIPSILLSCFMLLELGFKVFPIQHTAALYEGVYGWENVLEMANKKLADVPSPKKALAVMNWTLGSRAMYYNKTDSEVFVLDARKDQFDIWNKNTPDGYDFIVIVEANKEKEHLIHLNCSQLNIIDELTNKIKEVPVNRFLYYHCVNFLDYR